VDPVPVVGSGRFRKPTHGYLIQFDPPGRGGAEPGVARRILAETNGFFAAHGEPLLDYQDALFVAPESLERS
jgi:hypothetical protein